MFNYQLNKYNEIVHYYYNKLTESKAHKLSLKKNRRVTNVILDDIDKIHYRRMVQAQEKANKYQAKYSDLLAIATKQQVLVLQSA